MLMDGYTKLPLRRLYVLMGLGFSAVMLATLEVMVQVKDPVAYMQWVQTLPVAQQISANVQIYISVQLLHYFSVVVMPMIFTVYTYFAYQKLRLNQLYVFIWTVMLAGSMGYAVIGRGWSDPWLYLNVAVYGALILNILSLIDMLKASKSK